MSKYAMSFGEEPASEETSKGCESSLGEPRKSSTETSGVSLGHVSQFKNATKVRSVMSCCASLGRMKKFEILDYQRILFLVIFTQLFVCSVDMPTIHFDDAPYQLFDGFPIMLNGNVYTVPFINKDVAGIAQDLFLVFNHGLFALKVFYYLVGRNRQIKVNVCRGIIINLNDTECNLARAFMAIYISRKGNIWKFVKQHSKVRFGAGSRSKYRHNLWIEFPGLPPINVVATTPDGDFERTMGRLIIRMLCEMQLDLHATERGIVSNLMVMFGSQPSETVDMIESFLIGYLCAMRYFSTRDPVYLYPLFKGVTSDLSDFSQQIREQILPNLFNLVGHSNFPPGGVDENGYEFEYCTGKINLHAGILDFANGVGKETFKWINTPGFKEVIALLMCIKFVRFSGFAPDTEIQAILLSVINVFLNSKSSVGWSFDKGADVFESLAAVAEFVKTTFSTFYNGNVPEQFNLNGTIASWNKSYQEFSNLPAIEDFLGNNIIDGSGKQITFYDYLAIQNKLLLDGTNIAKTIVAGVVPWELKKFRNNFQLLQSLCISNGNFLASVQTRQKPFAVFLCGAPSIGKSNLLNLFDDAFRVFNKLPMGDEFKYTVHPSSKFWDNFRSSMHTLQYDDLGASKMAPGVACSLSTIIPVVNDIPYMSDQADLSNKGRTPVLVKHVMATSNYPTMNAHQLMNDVGYIAILRRFNFMIEPEVKPEFADNIALNLASLDGSNEYHNYTVSTLHPINTQGAISLEKRPVNFSGVINGVEVKIENGFCTSTRDMRLWYGYQGKYYFDNLARHRNGNSCPVCKSVVSPCLCNGGLFNLQSGRLFSLVSSMCDSVRDEAFKTFNSVITYGANTFGTTLILVIYFIILLLCYRLWALTIMLVIGLLMVIDGTIVSGIYIAILHLVGNVILSAILFSSAHVGSLFACLITAFITWICVNNYGLIRAIFSCATLYKRLRGVNAYLNAFGCAIPEGFMGVLRNRYFKSFMAIIFVFAGAITLYCNQSKAILQTGYVDCDGRKPEPNQWDVWASRDPPSFGLCCATNKGRQGIENFQRLIKKHTVRLMGTMCQGYGLVLDRFHIITCAHVISSLNGQDKLSHPQDGLVSLRFESNGSERDRYYNIQSSMSGLSYKVVACGVGSVPGQQDYCIIKLSSPLTGFRSLLTRDHPFCVNAVISDYGICKDVKIPNVALNGDNVCFYSNSLTDGDSGLPIIGVYNNTPFLAGLHTGKVRGSTDQSIYQPIRFGLIKHLVCDTNSFELLVEGEPEVDLQSNFHSMFYGHDMLPANEGGIVTSKNTYLHGCVHGMRQVFKSKYIVTPWMEMAQDFFKEHYGLVCEKFPPIDFSSWLPKMYWINKVNSIQQLDEQRIRQICRKVYSRHVGNLKSKINKTTGKTEFDSFNEYIGVISEDEAINGKLDDPGMGKLNMKTSAGFPWCQDKESLCDVREVVGEKIYWQLSNRPVNCKHTRLGLSSRELMSRVVDRLKAGQHSGVPFIARLKDEPIKPEKLKTRGPRLFMCSSLPISVLFRQYFLKFVCAIKHNNLLFNNVYGVNAHSKMWSKIYEKLSRFKFWLDGDFTAFDVNISSIVIRCVIDEIIWPLVCDSIPIEDHMLAKTLLYEIVNPLCLVDNELLTVFGTNPSGNSLTTIVNCFSNIVYYVLAWDDTQTCGDFFDYCELVVYGDDSVMTTDTEGFNCITIGQALAKYGITYTSSSKEQSSVRFSNPEKVVLLQRTFSVVNDPVFGEIVLAPLNKSSVLKSLTVSDSVASIKSVVESMFFESYAMLDGDDLRIFLNKLLVHVGHTPLVADRSTWLGKLVNADSFISERDDTVKHH